MSDRRRIPRIPRTVRARPPRRRMAIGLLAAVAVVALAGAIGSRSTDNQAKQVSRSASSAGSASTRARTPGDPNAYSAEDAAVAAGTQASGGKTGVANTATSSGLNSKSGQASSGDALGIVGADPLQAKIIRTGSVGLVVKQGTFAEAVSKLTATATGVGGFVAASETSQLGSDPHGTVTLRVPAKDFDRVLARIDELGTIASVTTGSQDVTSEYTDVAARIKTLQDEREQISLVLSRAQSIPDILSVRDRLNTVQGELEQLQGRQKVLDDQTSLSTISIDVSEKGAAHVIGTQPTADRKGLAKVWHDAADRFGDGARSIAIGFAALAPWLLLGLVLWLPARWLWRRGVPAASAPSEVASTTAD